jgi:hypothetical protein
VKNGEILFLDVITVLLMFVCAGMDGFPGEESTAGSSLGDGPHLGCLLPSLHDGFCCCCWSGTSVSSAYVQYGVQWEVSELRTHP